MPTGVRLSLTLISVYIPPLFGLLILSRVDFSHLDLLSLLATLQASIDGRAPSLYPCGQLSAYRHAAAKVTLNLLIIVLVNGQVCDEVTRTRLVLIYVISKYCIVRTRVVQ